MKATFVYSRIFAGFDVIEAIILSSFRESLWNNSRARGNKVSTPVAPVAAWAKVNLLDSSSSGLWSETITSISPSPIALINDNRSCSVLSGGDSFKKVLKSPISFSFKDKLFIETPVEKILPSSLALFIVVNVFLEDICEIWYLQWYSSSKDKSLSTIIFSAKEGIPFNQV